MRDLVHRQYWLRKRAQKYIYVAFTVMTAAALLNTIFGNIDYNIYIVSSIAAILALHVGWAFLIGLLMIVFGVEGHFETEEGYQHVSSMQSAMAPVDVLIITALEMEHDAARASLEAAGASMTSQDEKTSRPYLAGELPAKGRTLTIALARPTRMGATAVGPIAGALSERLQPICLAMSGVCAGNPTEVALGDVVIAECAYTYDEGKRTANGFEPDHRQVPLDDKWLRAAQDMDPEHLPTYGTPNHEDSRLWLLSQLHAGADPRKHPARDRYLGGGKWTSIVTELERDGLIGRDGRSFAITDAGREAFDHDFAYTIQGPTKLPFAVTPGPIASGNVVVKDGVTWDTLKTMGVRTVTGLEMEAAVIAQTARRLSIPHWIVAKGVMDHADPKKEDRMKPFAARASAEVLVHLLQTVPF